MNENQMLLRDAGIREQEFAQTLLEKLPSGITYEDILTHGVYDARADEIVFTVKGCVYNFKVTRA